MYYSPSKKCFFDDGDLSMFGLPVDEEELNELGYFHVIFNTVEYNENAELIEPDGEPVPLSKNSNVYVQNYRVVDILKEAKERKVDVLDGIYEVLAGSGFKATDNFFIPTDFNTVQRLHHYCSIMEDGDTRSIKLGRNVMELSSEEMKTVVRLASVYIRACIDVYNNFLLEINNAESLDDLANIDLQTGWPDRRMKYFDRRQEERLIAHLYGIPDRRSRQSEAAYKGQIAQHRASVASEIKFSDSWIDSDPLAINLIADPMFDGPTRRQRLSDKALAVLARTRSDRIHAILDEVEEDDYDDGLSMMDA